MDKYRIDMHKLMYHPQRVAKWLAGENVYPIYMEISPSGACNHRCTFCGLDFMGYQARFLDTEILKKRLTELGQLGLKSLMHGGEGEPLLHRDFSDIVKHGKLAGIDQSLTTNAVLLTEEKAKQLLPNMEWIKVSFNAGCPESYAKIHQTKEQDFHTALANIKNAVRLRSENNWSCTIGIQLILLEDNGLEEALALAKISREIGADYLVIKPYSQHLQSNTKEYENANYEEALTYEAKFKECSTENFQAIFRARTMQKWDDKTVPYSRCLALPFWSYIDAGGGVWGCSVYLEDERFHYGNINENSFEDIWNSQKRKDNLLWVKEHLDTCDCRVNCRMDEINRYLDELINNPPPHVNFI